MSIVIEDIDTLPKVTRRSSKSSAELLALQEKIRSQTPGRIRDITNEDFAKISQRIRYAARKEKMDVHVIRENKRENMSDIAFEGYNR